MSHQGNGPVSVVVSLIPQKFFVEKIGGRHVTVTVLVDQGASEHAYEPKPVQMAALARADIYFSMGLEFEKVWIGRFIKKMPGLHIAACDSGIVKIAMQSSHHDHEGEQSRDDNGLDPHIWLSPGLVKTIAANITAHLCAVDTEHATEYRGNAERFIGEINALQDTIRAILGNAGVREIIVFHPSWGYFAREFGLIQIPIELEGKEPMAGELKEVIAHARERSITTIFVQPQFSRKTAGFVAAQIGGTVKVLDPLAAQWDVNLIHSARAMAQR
jgi:zinc transport system substrate-binding protein